jgi:hypothetical protein
MKILVSAIALAWIALMGAHSSTNTKAMLWETTVQTVSHTLLDSERRGWKSRVGPPETAILCLAPYRPRKGKVARKDVDCTYTKVDDRDGKVFRKRVCIGSPRSFYETTIIGTEDNNHYDLTLSSTLRDANRKLIETSEMREIGRMIGECPEDTPVHGGLGGE